MINGNNIFKTFVGEYVLLTLKVYLMEAKDTEQENYSFQVPMTKEGYLLEQDKYSYYFGKDPSQVSFAIKKKDISIIEIAMQNNPFDDILNNIGPKSDKEIN